MSVTITTSTPAETFAHAHALAALAQAGETWALVGDLGAGKTHFVQGIASGLASSATVTSPTFTLVHEYPDGRFPLYHFDFYRLRSAGEILSLGWDEYLAAPGLTVVEWADKFPELLPSDTRWFHFTILDPTSRRITETRE